MDVRLTWMELYQAAQVGAVRQIEALKLNRPDRYGYSGDGWSIHITGAAAELAVAKASGRYWHALATRPSTLPGDVGRMQVRWTSRRDGDLILHPDDGDETPFILVVGAAPTFTLVGWVLGFEGKRSEWWRDPAGGRPAFFVPQAELTPVEVLFASEVHA